MPTLTEDPITLKTRELCETIISQPGFQQLREDIDTFMADSDARAHYGAVTSKQSELHRKQHDGEDITEEDVSEFERLREILVNNEIARRFLEAQQEMHRATESVSQYVSKTFQLGRVPNEDDFEKGSCGPGCGCRH